jgi:hypothetical protein
MRSSVAEHPTFNRLVVGSIPSACILDSLTAKQRTENPLIVVQFHFQGTGYSSMVERWFVVPTVMGSIPIIHQVLRLVVRTSFFHDDYTGSIPVESNYLFLVAISSVVEQ